MHNILIDCETHQTIQIQENIQNVENGFGVCKDEFHAGLAYMLDAEGRGVEAVKGIENRGILSPDNEALLSRGGSIYFQPAFAYPGINGFIFRS